MATKTISVDIEAYERLRQARRSPTESFSRVIKRAHWEEEKQTLAALLASSVGLPIISEDSLDELDRAQSSDVPPEDPWAQP